MGLFVFGYTVGVLSLLALAAILHDFPNRDE